MGAIVVLVVAIVIMLLLAVVVAVMRLLTAVRALRTAVDSSRQWLQPVLDELNEGEQVMSLELAQLQASVADLTAQRRSAGNPDPPGTTATLHEARASRA
jgi:predicted PurR-regulated permease PerM